MVWGFYLNINNIPAASVRASANNVYIRGFDKKKQVISGLNYRHKNSQDAL